LIMTYDIDDEYLVLVIPTLLGVGLPVYDCTVDFGDGTIVDYTSNGNGEGSVQALYHTYDSGGIYTVTITGDFPAIAYQLGAEYSDELLSIDQWGNMQWEHLSFRGCSNLVFNATDIPDLSLLTSLRGTFRNCINFNSDISNWDVSNVESLLETFRGASSFNQDLSNWNVSNVTNMEDTFQGASAFNQALNSWDVSNVINMEETFYGASNFNQALNNWDVSNVENMRSTFKNASTFNQDLSSWDFNANIIFSGSFSYDSFIYGTGIDIENYDLLLERFVDLGIENKTLFLTNTQYCNELDRQILIETLNWTIDGDEPSEYCSSNTLFGEIRYDQNNDGCDTEDLIVTNFSLNASNNEDNITQSFYNEDLNYNLFLEDGSYTVNLVNVPEYFTVNPTDLTVDFVGTEEIVNQNFCITANQSVEDLIITLLPLNEARPGFESNYKLIVKNVGTETINNISVSLNFDEEMQDYITSTPNSDNTLPNQLNFNIGTLFPFGRGIIDITMLTFQPPIVNENDVLNFEASVLPQENDYTVENNVYNLRQNVVNSFDPNDKRVLQGEQITIDEIGNYLDYIIRFQNTGSADAINVIIEDTLHPNLNYSSLNVISSSHNYRLNINPENKVEFIFEDIQLPSENIDAEGSNGYIAYKIKPKDDVSLGDFITGNASIYFDYNLPIITNMVSTEVVENLDVENYSLKNNILVYPNPVNNLLHLSVPSSIEIEEAKIYNLQGKEIFISNSNLKSIDTNNLLTGIYILYLKTNKGILNFKLIKQ
ncbi:BspA family leucine-rich repeat surface protein, partial [Mesonia sp.]|uniref:BspA family leucine-rich repeat surface protein n=1 Tax=Mesonia sp. TaxID=1960830 RepID=UPI00176F2744